MHLEVMQQMAINPSPLPPHLRHNASTNVSPALITFFFHFFFITIFFIYSLATRTATIMRQLRPSFNLPSLYHWLATAISRGFFSAFFLFSYLYYYYYYYHFTAKFTISPIFWAPNSLLK